MTADNTSDRTPSSSMFWASAIIWLAVLGMIAVYVWKWRTMNWPPNYLFVAIPLVVIALAIVVLLVVGLKRLLIGPKRLAAFGTFVIAMAPLLVLPLLCIDLYWRGANLQPIQRGWLVDPVAFLISDAADYEVNNTLPNRVGGEHVVLMQDQPNEDAERLVEEMDQHISDISQILGQAPPDQIYWVRGSVFDVEARSMIGWAITSDPEEKDRSTLRPIDKHEVAHATISLLSEFDSSPPTVIVEGWAEVCSLETDELNDRFRTYLRESNTAIPLKNTDLLEYDRNQSNAPYAVGGAMVSYLIDRWGGEKFMTLYRSSNDDNFRSNFESIYEISWTELEVQFSNDFAKSFPGAFIDPADERDVLLEAANAIADVELGENVDEELWEELTESAIIEYSVRSEVPEKPVAFYSETESKDLSTGTEKRTLYRYHINGENFYRIELVGGNSYVVQVTPSTSLTAERLSDEIERTSRLLVDGPTIDGLRESIKNDVVNFRLESDLVALIREMQESGPTTIERLSRVNPDIYEMQFVAGRGAEKVSLEVTVDAQKGYRAVSYRYFGSALDTMFTNEIVQKPDRDWYVTERKTEFKKDGEIAGEATTQMGVMDERQLRSFLDEIGYIEPSDFSNGVPAPLWLRLLHYGAYAWWAVAGLFLIGFGLFRL